MAGFKCQVLFFLFVSVDETEFSHMNSALLTPLPHATPG